MESVVFVLQVSSIIETVVKEVDKALQLLHSRVCFILYAGSDFTYNVFIKFAKTVLQLKRTIVSVALWDGEHDTMQSK